jgi:xanthine dehydrogenase D subunit
MAEAETGVLTRRGVVGRSPLRPDGTPKTQGRFAFSSDLWEEGMLWGTTLRSPHPSARITGIDLSAAWRIPGVRVVLTADSVPGEACYGMITVDQPVFASEVVRYVGEPIAALAADHPETARRAAQAIRVGYEPLEPVLDMEAAFEAAPIHPDGNVLRSLPVRRGDPTASGPVVVEGHYEIGMQDQAFMGPESGLAVPAEDGGVDLYISTQCLHVDRDQVAACLGLPADKVRLVLSGVGGAFGGREDISLQVHLCLLALKSGRPVKMVYSREESFLGHVHRHPARIWMRHHADRDGGLVKVEARILLDGGAYASSSYHVVGNAVCFAPGPYRVPNAVIDGYALRTNNPPCGAMRGFGVVQACFAHESQMDRLAAAIGMDPVELRLRNALRPGDELVTGQRVTGTLPVADVIRATAALPMPPPADGDPLLRPGGAGLTADQQHLRRGVGFGVGFKNLMFSEGSDDYSTASCRLWNGVVTIKCACAEVGQGFVTLAQQVARTVLGVDEVVLDPADTTIGPAGSSSASRQTWMSGGAVDAACRAVRDHVVAHVAGTLGLDPHLLTVEDGRVRSLDGSVDVPVAKAAPEVRFEHTAEFHHAPTHPLDGLGQGNAHVSFACAAHRAVVDVDPELGLVKVAQIATAQDVGRALNPLQVTGQIEGGIAQAVGLAVMEELILDGGRIRNPSFTDYLIPTALDAPSVVATLVEEPEPGAPFGAKGVGEPPAISPTPAVVAAIRAATGAPLNRVPVRPQDIAMAGAGD